MKATQVHIQLSVREPSATRCAQRTARAVFPTPAIPPIAEITTATPSRALAEPSMLVSAVSSA